MNTDLITEIAKERYEKEHDRKNQINNSLSIPIVVIVALIGVVGYFLMNVPLKMIFVSPAWVWIVFALFMFLLLCMGYCLMRAIYFLSKVFVGLTYGYMPTPKAVRKYAEDLREHYEEYYEMDENEIKEAIGNDIQSSLLVDEYCEYTENNVICNNDKVFFLTKAKELMILALVILSISIIPFIVLHYQGQIANEKIQKIEIIGSK